MTWKFVGLNSDAFGRVTEDGVVWVPRHSYEGPDEKSGPIKWAMPPKKPRKKKK